jgi:hypothetical protein
MQNLRGGEARRYRSPHDSRKPRAAGGFACDFRLNCVDSATARKESETFMEHAAIFMVGQTKQGLKPGRMRVIRGTIRQMGGAAALAALLLVPAASAGAKVAKRKPQSSLLATSGTFGAFTPAAADPRVAAAFARSGLGTGMTGTPFRFTPSGNTAGRRAITVAVRARAVSRTDAAKALGLASDGLAPSAYSLGASIGWKRFALSGDVAKMDNPLLPTGRESADLGLSFFGKRWETKLDVAGERATNDKPAIGIDEAWSVGVGGSYALTRNLNVSGGVRYKTQRDDPLNLLDTRRDSQAVYLGTTFKF